MFCSISFKPWLDAYENFLLGKILQNGAPGSKLRVPPAASDATVDIPLENPNVIILQM